MRERKPNPEKPRAGNETLRPDLLPDVLPDVLVVGLGPAGARAAEAAAARGASVLAVDRRHVPGEPVQCAEFVPHLLAQETAGLAAVTRQTIERMDTFVEDRPPDAADLGIDLPGRMIDRAAFDRGLIHRAREAGADCRTGLAVRAIEVDGEVHLSDGRKLRPKVLIGADGPRSTVGRAIGRINREIVETRQIRVRLLVPGTATEIFLRAGFEGGYGWLFPRGRAANLGLGLRPGARRRLKAGLSDLHQTLATEGRVGRRVLETTGGAIPVGGPLEPVGRLSEVTVLLAGDAAGLTHPITGAGIAAAVLSGAWAGRAAADWAAGKSATIAEYAEELEETFAALMARALTRRRELLVRFERGGAPRPADLRRAWIAFPEYWAA